MNMRSLVLVGTISGADDVASEEAGAKTPGGAADLYFGGGFEAWHAVPWASLNVVSERRYGVSWEPAVRRLMGADPGNRGQRVEGEDCPQGEDAIGKLSDGLWATAPLADGTQELADVVLLRGQTDLAERFRVAGCMARSGGQGHPDV